MCTECVQEPPEVKRGHLDPLELEIQHVVSDVSARNLNLGPLQEQQMLLTCELFLHVRNVILINLS